MDWRKDFDKKFGVTNEKQELPEKTWEYYGEVKSFIENLLEQERKRILDLPCMEEETHTVKEEWYQCRKCPMQHSGGTHDEAMEALKEEKLCPSLEEEYLWCEKGHLYLKDSEPTTPEKKCTVN